MNQSINFVLNELSLKFEIPLALYEGKQIQTFPKDEKYYDELKSILTGNTPNLDIVDYFQIEGQLCSRFNCYYKEKKTLTVLIGPYSIDNLIRLADISCTHNPIPVFNSTIIQRKQFITFTAIVYNLLKGTSLPPVPDWLNFKETLHEIYQLSEVSVESRRLSSDSFEDSVELEKRFLDAVRRNKPDIIEWIVSKVSTTYSAQLSPNKLENVKYKCVGIITLITRISINSGLSALRAYSLSDSLIKTLYKITTIAECLHFIKESAFMFMDLIHHFPYSTKSELVKKILFYIDSNIYNKITIDEISSYTERHKTYISSEFKKEMNQTIHTYINIKKVFEAKHLLILTNQSYKEISSILNFSSQSHFNQIFKKIEGISPAQYRLINSFNFLAIK